MRLANPPFILFCGIRGWKNVFLGGRADRGHGGVSSGVDLGPSQGPLFTALIAPSAVPGSVGSS